MKTKQRGEVTVKGWVDPRRGDELVVGIIIGFPGDLETKEGRDRTTLNAKAVQPMLKSIPSRQSYILWEDGTGTQRFSGSGPAPDYPPPDRPAVRAIIDPLPEVEVDYETKRTS